MPRSLLLVASGESPSLPLLDPSISSLPTTAGASKRIRRSMRFGCGCLLIAILCGFAAVTVPMRAATQEEFFKSMKEETADTGDPSGMKLIGGILGAVAVIMLLSLISLRQKREIKPKPVNHPGKLLKEITKRIQLRPAEIKQLRLLAENQPSDEAQIDNPLVLLLCPSVLAKSLKRPPVRLDRKVIAGLARKLGLAVAKGKKQTKPAHASDVNK